MKELIKFLEKNSKWVVRVLVVVGIGFIVKLWLFGLKITKSGGGGYIDIGFGWNFEYFWIASGYISVLLFFISIVLLFIISINKKIKTKLILAVLIFILGISAKQIFFIVSPEFKFYLTPVTKQYKDNEGNVIDIDKYLESIEKYCKYDRNDLLHYMYGKEQMCANNDKFQTFFKTIDEYIMVFNFANKTSNKGLYNYTYGGANKFGIEKIIEKYSDETFYAYVFGWELSNIKILNLMILNIENEKFKNLLNYLINRINNYNKSNFTKEQEDIYFSDLYKELNIKINQIPQINNKIINIY